MLKYSLSGLVAVLILVPTLTLARDSDTRPIKVNAGFQLGQLKRNLTTEVQVALSGKVTAVNGSTLTITVSNGTTYAVDASQAKLIRRFGGSMTVSDVQVNDQIYVQGTLTGTAIKARAIQDNSLQTRNGSFTGTIQSISGSSLVLQTQNKGMQTVMFTSATKIMRGNVSATWSNLAAGNTIRVEGVWNSTNNNVAASKIQIVVKSEEVRMNGTVTNVNGNTLTMTGSDGKTYTVDATQTKVAGRSFFGTDLTKIKVGDAVQAWGKTMTGSLQIKANLVIDFSM